MTKKSKIIAGTVGGILVLGGIGSAVNGKDKTPKALIVTDTAFSAYSYESTVSTTNSPVESVNGTIDDLQQDVVSEPVSVSESAIKSVYSAPAEPASTVEVTPAPTAPEHQVGEVCVALSGNGKKYHNNSNCSRMNGNVRWMSISEAQALGYSACKRCY